MKNLMIKNKKIMTILLIGVMLLGIGSKFKRFCFADSETAITPSLNKTLNSRIINFVKIKIYIFLIGKSQ